MIEEFSITIKKIKKPKNSNLNQDIQIISQSLGLFTKRDKEKSCFRVFIEILKHKGLTAEEITVSTNLTRATVIHHLNSLMKNGLVVKKRHRYYLRGDSLENLIKEVSKDMDRTFSDLMRLGKNIDKNL